MDEACDDALGTPALRKSACLMSDASLQITVKAYVVHTRIFEWVLLGIVEDAIVILVVMSGCGKSVVPRMIARLAAITGRAIYTSDKANLFECGRFGKNACEGAKSEGAA